MSADREALTRLNIQIGEAETRGDRHWLSDAIAPKLAFRRADRNTVDDRTEFLKIAPGEPRETTLILSTSTEIEPLSDAR